jgi:hypothetical protein
MFKIAYSGKNELADLIVCFFLIRINNKEFQEFHSQLIFQNIAVLVVDPQLFLSDLDGYAGP